MKTPPLALTAVIALAAPAYAQDATEKFAASETAFSKCLAKQAETRADYFVPGIGFLPGKLIANCYGDWWQFHNACLRTGAALSECAGLTNALAMNAAVSGGQQNRSARVGNVQSANPSFDCGKARTQDEHIICSDSRLSELDQADYIAYRQAEEKSKDEARSAASDSLASRHSCGDDRLCISDQQVNAISILSALGSQVPIPPWVGAYRVELFRRRVQPLAKNLSNRIGQCTITKIASISTRFGEALTPPVDEMDSSGTQISFANGGYQVSYSYVPAIADSHIGDDVFLCLVSLPKNCPPGDERGKVYSGTNQKTRGYWLLPDAQHTCGGA